MAGLNDIAPTSTVARFYACVWPDFYAVMSPCERDFYQWVDQIPWASLPAHLQAERQRIANATYQQQYQQWLACEQSRMANQPTPQFGVHLSVASRLAGGGVDHAGVAPATPQGQTARLSVSFASGSGPLPPLPCPSIGFAYLNRVSRVDIHYHSANTRAELVGPPAFAELNGIGPWEGSQASLAYDMGWASMQNFAQFFKMNLRVYSALVFEHSATFEPIKPVPPASLAARAEPFNVAAVNIQAIVDFNWSAPAGSRGHSWQVYQDFIHDSGASWVQRLWLEYPQGWSPVGVSGFAVDQTLNLQMPTDVVAQPLLDGTWTHRLCVEDFRRMASPVQVFYQGLKVAEATTSISTLLSTPYVPGVSQGIALAQETVTIRTVGVTKRSFKIVDVQPVSGIGVYFVIQVINDLHFDACIVTTFLSGIDDRSTGIANDAHFKMPTVFVVRNLAANSQSEPFGVLVPIEIRQDGDWPLKAKHWAAAAPPIGYAAAFNQFPDGTWGMESTAPHSFVPAPVYQVNTSAAGHYAWLLAATLADGSYVYNPSHDASFDWERVLLTLPAHKAQGTPLSSVTDPRFLGGVTIFDERPFSLFFDYTVEVKISTSSPWEVRAGTVSTFLSPTDALSRYGRYLTLPVADARPLWSPYWNRWLCAFEVWPGGDVTELTAFLSQQGMRENLNPAAFPAGWRNLSITVRKPPYLTAGLNRWSASSPPADRLNGYLDVFTLINETISPNNVTLMLMGWS